MPLNQWGHYAGLLGGRKSYSSVNIFGCGPGINTLTSVTSTAWPAANVAIYAPIGVEANITLAQLWWLNGATASGNVDIGLYTVDGVRITSAGSTVQSGVSAIQSVNVTDVRLGPGLYYLALALDNTTGTVGAQSTGAVVLQVAGYAEQATAFPLPAVATLASMTRVPNPAMGLVGDAVL